MPFEVYADGIDLVIFEEFGSGAMALHLQEKLARDELMRDPAYRERFRKDYESKYGPRVWHRDFFDAEIVACPDESVVGKSFGQVGVERGGKHPVDAFLDLVLEHGTDIRWRTTISNHRPGVLKKLAADSGIQIGFSDAGAHLRNMAFYNFGLRLLKHVHDAERAGKPFMTTEHAVHRLTGELGEWYRIDAGTLRVGRPRRPGRHRPGPARRLRGGATTRRPSSSTAVCRGWSTATTPPYPPSSSAAAASSTDGEPTPLLGAERTGQFLRAEQTAPRRPISAPTVGDHRRSSRRDPHPHGGRPRSLADALGPRLRRHRRLGHRRLHLSGHAGRADPRRPRARRHRQAAAGRAGADSRRTRTTTACSSPTATT